MLEAEPINTSQSIPDNEIPPEYKCSITHEIMRDPVSTPDGHAYERAAIEEWLKEHNTSPKTGLVLPHKQVIPAWDLKNAIETFVKDYFPRKQKEQEVKKKHEEELFLLQKELNDTRSKNQFLELRFEKTKAFISAKYIPEKLMNTPGVWYTDADISDYLDLVIEYELGKLGANKHYLLSSEFADEEDQCTYLVAIAPAIDYLKIKGQPSLSFDYFLNKGKQPFHAIAVHLQQLLDLKALPQLEALKRKPKELKDQVTEILKKITQDKQDEDTISRIMSDLEEAQFEESNLKELIAKLHTHFSQHDVFDELNEIFLKQSNVNVKILFPYNNRERLHWLTGEIKIHKQDLNYQIELYAHDPCGGGCLEEDVVDSFKNALLDKISHLHVDAKPEINCISPISPFASLRQAVGDGNSCGVIVADEIIKRIQGKSLAMAAPHPNGVPELRKQHLQKVEEYCKDDKKPLLKRFQKLNNPVTVYQKTPTSESNVDKTSSEKRSFKSLQEWQKELVLTAAAKGDGHIIFPLLSHQFEECIMDSIQQALLEYRDNYQIKEVFLNNYQLFLEENINQIPVPPVAEDSFSARISCFSQQCQTILNDVSKKSSEAILELIETTLESYGMSSSSEENKNALDERFRLLLNDEVSFYKSLIKTMQEKTSTPLCNNLMAFEQTFFIDTDFFINYYLEKPSNEAELKLWIKNVRDLQKMEQLQFLHLIQAFIKELLVNVLLRGAVIQKNSLQPKFSVNHFRELAFKQKEKLLKHLEPWFTAVVLNVSFGEKSHFPQREEMILQEWRKEFDVFFKSTLITESDRLSKVDLLSIARFCHESLYESVSALSHYIKQRFALLTFIMQNTGMQIINRTTDVVKEKTYLSFLQKYQSLFPDYASTIPLPDEVKVMVEKQLQERQTLIDSAENTFHDLKSQWLQVKKNPGLIQNKPQIEKQASAKVQRLRKELASLDEDQCTKFVEIFESQLNEFEVPLDISDKEGSNLLQIAFQNGHYELSWMLLLQGVSPNAKSEEEVTLIGLADKSDSLGLLSLIKQRTRLDELLQLNKHKEVMNVYIRLLKGCLQYDYSLQQLLRGMDYSDEERGASHQSPFGSPFLRRSKKLLQEMKTHWIKSTKPSPLSKLATNISVLFGSSPPNENIAESMRTTIIDIEAAIRKAYWNGHDEGIVDAFTQMFYVCKRDVRYEQFADPILMLLDEYNNEETALRKDNQNRVELKQTLYADISATLGRMNDHRGVYDKKIDDVEKKMEKKDTDLREKFLKMTKESEKKDVKIQELEMMLNKKDDETNKKIEEKLKETDAETNKKIEEKLKEKDAETNKKIEEMEEKLRREFADMLKQQQANSHTDPGPRP